MRLLIITSRLPFPPSWGAAARDYQLARHLAHRNRVTMLCYAQPEEAKSADALRRELDDVRIVTLDDSGRVGRRLSQVRTLVSTQPFATREGRGSSIQLAAQRLLDEDAFDLVQVESVRMNALRLPSSVTRVLDEHNVEYELLQRMARGERSLSRRAFNSAEQRKLRRFEIASWRSVDACLLTSRREEAIVRAEAPGIRTLTVPNGVDTEYFRPIPEQPEPDTIVFTGNLNYRPNIDGVLYLVEQIFPLIVRRRPLSTLTIVGGGGEALRRLERPGIRFTGWVPDLRPYLQRAAVVVVPLRIGGGTRLKVLEAFSTGKAVVSTTLGAEGIDAEDGRHLLLADEPAAFAEHVADVLEEPERARRLGEAATALVRERYSWAHVSAELEGFYEDLIRERAAPGWRGPRG